MDEVMVNRIIENMIALLPVFHKKLFRMDMDGIAGHLNRLHFAIMGILSAGDTTVSEMAKLLAASKSQMTLLINQLVILDIVERNTDTRDRRVIHLRLTEHGLFLCEEMKQKVIEKTREKLAGLQPDELKAMSEALTTLRNVLAKL